MRIAIVAVIALAMAGAAIYLWPADPERAAVPPAADVAPPAAPAHAAATSADTSGTATPTVPPRTPEIERQARGFIARLTETDPEPVAVDHADRFVSGEQVLRLVPQDSIRVTTPAEIASDGTLGPDTPLTVVREIEQIESLSPERLIADAGGDLDREIRVMEHGRERVRTVREVLDLAAREPQRPIAVVRKTRYFEVTTPAEIAAAGGDDSQPIGIVKAPYALETATVAEIMRQDESVGPDSVFYVRTVRANDGQGIWGIIFDGLVDNFARGMAIRRGRDVNTYRVDIPRDADELLGDRSSSFLGRLIDDKARRSYVYNFRDHRMGHNPDLIVPGQQIVIITFQPEELIDIYAHFVSRQG